MNDFGDYLDEMDRNRTTDVEIERLFSGSPELGEDLKPLADVFSALQVGERDQLSDEIVGRIVAVAARTAAASTPAPASSPAPRSRSLFGALRRRAATVAVAATVVIGGTGGLAVAADGAMPGDTLYGIDRALETIGIGAGGEEERLGEADALINAGEVIHGLEHAAEALAEHEAADSDASIALMEAADRVRAAGGEPSAVTRDRVAGLLSYLAENAGDVDGRQVAELAVQIGRPEGRPNASPSPGQADPQGPPADSPADPPGLTDREPGPPDDVPSSPPGQDKDKNEPGPPEGVPADPPGRDKDKNEPGPPDSLPNDKP
jgi:hypothetical protein